MKRSYLSILRIHQKHPNVKLLSLLAKNWRYIPFGLIAYFTLRKATIESYNSLNIESINLKNPFQTAEEKDDLIKRADWLCKKLIVKNPAQIIASMPTMIGREFQGQWAIYACSMTAFSLINIIRLYPDLREKYIDDISRLIDLVYSPEIRHYDTMWWHEDPINSLDGENSHMTYISILAWMIGNYKLVGGDYRYDELHIRLCNTLNRRMLKQPFLNLPSFPNGVVFFPDMMFSILALKDYGRIHNNEFDNTISKWIEITKRHWIDKQTGLLASSYFRNNSLGRISGAYSALNTTCLLLIDKSFGISQYKTFKYTLGVRFGKFWEYAAIREYLRPKKNYAFEIDAGPIIFGLSPSGTAFAIGAATFIGDWNFRKAFLNMAELAGHTVKRAKYRHYRLSDIFLTGEAITLAMRTMVDFNRSEI